jgi:hypothetical protein
MAVPDHQPNEHTAKLRRIDPDAPIPMGSARQKSSELSRAVGHLVAELVSQRGGADTAASKAAGELTEELLEAVRADRRSLPWILLGAVLFATLAAFGGLMWQRVNDLEAYDRDLAFYLVTSQHEDYTRFEGLAAMTRRIAETVGADVRDIDFPGETEPPRSVRMKSLQADQ